jgi:TRAP-type C4-dicarboxylate transport system permease small subunit
MSALGKASAWIFGAIMIVLSLLVTVETVVRKVFSISLGGVDELSGYAIAIGAPLAFAVASLEHSHIRINLLYAKLPAQAQAILNVLAVLSIATAALFFALFASRTLTDTIEYKSIAQTPWATPLVYPQSIWLVSMVVFAAIACLLALLALRALVSGRIGDLAAKFGPERVEDELSAELEQLKQR